jgi:hypothetical protein
MMRRDKSLALAEGARLFVRKIRHGTKRIMDDWSVLVLMMALIVVIAIALFESIRSRFW